VSDLLYWTVDESAGHLAHPSGLYAYFSGSLTETGGILCTGPFSSYTQRLTKKDVFYYTQGAIKALEELFGSGCYTLWGTYYDPRNDHATQRKIEILGEVFNFVANPCFRTSVLLSNNTCDDRTQKDLQREWGWSPDSSEATHSFGLRFSFSRTPKNQLCCDVSIAKRTADLEFLGRELKPLLLKSLSTAALSVINTSMKRKVQHWSREKLSISVAGSILAP